MQTLNLLPPFPLLSIPVSPWPRRCQEGVSREGREARGRMSLYKPEQTEGWWGSEYVSKCDYPVSWNLVSVSIQIWSHLHSPTGTFTLPWTFTLPCCHIYTPILTHLHSSAVTFTLPFWHIYTPLLSHLHSPCCHNNPPILADLHSAAGTLTFDTPLLSRPTPQTGNQVAPRCPSPHYPAPILTVQQTSVT